MSFEVHVHYQGKTCLVFRSSLGEIDSACRRASHEFEGNKRRVRTSNAFKKWLDGKMSTMVEALKDVEASSVDHDLMRDLFVTSAVTIFLDKTAHKERFSAAILDIIDDTGTYTVHLVESPPEIQPNENEDVILQDVAVDPTNLLDVMSAQGVPAGGANALDEKHLFWLMSAEEVREVIRTTLTAQFQQRGLRDWGMCRRRALIENSDLVVQSVIDTKFGIVTLDFYFTEETLTEWREGDLLQVIKEFNDSECHRDRDNGCLIYSSEWVVFVPHQRTTEGAYPVVFQVLDEEGHSQLLAHVAEKCRLH